MNTARSGVSTLLESLPEDTGLEEIQYHHFALEKAKRGAERAERKGTVSHEAVRQRMGKWLAV